MIITATQTNTRQAPRKVRLVANAVRKLPLEDALRQLAVMERRASMVVLKVMRQAIANAEHNHGVKFADLTLKNIIVDAGPQYKRFQAVSRGRGHQILKKTSHVRVELERISAGEVVAEKQATKSPAKKTDQKAVKTTKKAATTKTAAAKTTKKAAPGKKAAAARKSVTKK